MDIDLVGTFNVTRAAFEHLRASRGKVINVSATLQYTGMPLVVCLKCVSVKLHSELNSTRSVHSLLIQGHASAAKAGIDALTRTLAVEWGPLGIRVNAIAP